MADEEKTERRWQWMVVHEDDAVRVVATRLSREPVLRKLFPFTTDRTLFRFTEQTTPTEWSNEMPYLEIVDREERCYAVWGAGVDPVATGTLEETAPVLVREVTAYLAKAKRQ